MMYKRRSFDNKRTHFDSGIEGKSPDEFSSRNPQVEAEKIPLPNEEEDAVEKQSTRHTQKPSIISFFKERIHIEEIILLGLIFVLLDEGIDDDLLLIVLVYILLT